MQMRFYPRLPAHIRREAPCITCQTAQIAASLTTASAPAQRLAVPIATRREERATPFTVRIVDRHGRPHLTIYPWSFSTIRTRSWRTAAKSAV